MSNIIKKINKEGITNLSIDELEKAIIYASDKYYNTDTPVLSDKDFDMLIEMLSLKNPNSNILNNIGANIKTKNKVKLDYWLGSMDKIKIDKKLNNWILKYKPPYNISDKLDGVSALLIYDKYKNIKLYTRGNGSIGQDITSLLKYIKLPNNVIDYCLSQNIVGNKNIIALRGELIITQEIFNNKWNKEFKNIRNTVSGVVNSKTINKDLAKDIDLVLYEIVDPIYNIATQMKYMNKMGFNVVYNTIINDNLTFELLSKILDNRRKESIYDIDGIIITTTSLYDRNKSGNPDYAFAYKDISDNQLGITNVINIEWNISKDGYIIPTIILEPIFISGVMIKRVTGNNAKFIVDNKIGIGSQVEIVRSGDVIPKINKVIKKAKVILPDGKWHWSETKVDIIIDNLDNNNLLIKNIYFFFSTLKTQGLGEKIIEKLVDNGIDSIIKILQLNSKDIISLPNFGNKSAHNLILNIKKSITNIDLSILMTASNKLGRGIGISRINDILNKYPNILIDYKKWNNKEFIDNIKSIDGWEDKTATLFVNNFNDFIEFYNSIKKYITLKEISIKSKPKYNIVLSGFRDDKLKLLIESLGGTISENINKNVDILVVKDKSIITNPTGKVLKAQNLGIKILTKEELILSLEGSNLN